MEGHEKEVAKEIVRKLSKLNLPVFPHIYTYQLWAGTLGVDVSKIPPHLLFDLENKEWKKVEVSKAGLLSFFANLIVGASLNDSTQLAYLKALFL